MGGGVGGCIVWLLETRNLGQCVWKLMTVCLPAFVECVCVARQRRKWAGAKCWIREERKEKEAEGREGKRGGKLENFN